MKQVARLSPKAKAVSQSPQEAWSGSQFREIVEKVAGGRQGAEDRERPNGQHGRVDVEKSPGKDQDGEDQDIFDPLTRAHRVDEVAHQRLPSEGRSLAGGAAPNKNRPFVLEKRSRFR